MGAQETKERDLLRRTDLLTRVTAVAIAAAALLCVGLLAGVADGKKKHKGKGGKVTVVSSQQQAILDAGAITVKVKGAKGKRVVVDGIQSSGAVRLTKAEEGQGGEADEPAALSLRQDRNEQLLNRGPARALSEGQEQAGQEEEGQEEEARSHHRTGARPCCLQRPEGSAV